jgi:DegV family protein with EDD domain
MIRILADSTCDLSKELIDTYHIGIIPLHILLGEKEFRDGVDLSPDDIYAWSEEHKATPKTSAVSFEDTVKILKPILDSGDEIIAFCISESMSSSGSVIRMAAEELKASEKVTVINSRNLSTGIGLMVLSAAEMAAEGKSTNEIIAEIEREKPFVRASFVVDTLEYLYRGGRCSGAAALAGTMLKIHPSIYVQNGEMLVGKKYRGKQNHVIMNYVKDMEEDLLKADSKRVFLTHSGRIDDSVKEVYSYLESLHRFNEILITRAGGVISSHCGPGSLGVLYTMK